MACRPHAIDPPFPRLITAALALASNMAGSDTDAVAFIMQGDFEASGLTLLDLNLIERRLIFDVGLFDFQLASNQYQRGIDSDPDTYISPEVKVDIPSSY